MLKTREIREFFHSPIFYVVMAVFLALSGYKFFSLLLSFIESMSYYPEYIYGDNIGSMMNLHAAYYIFPQLFMFYSYLCVMAVSVLDLNLGRDRMLGLDKVELLSGNKSVLGLVLRKSLSTSVVVCSMMVPTLLYPAIISVFTELDWGMILSAYLGLFILVGLSSGIVSVAGVFKIPFAVGIFLNMVILLSLNFYFFEHMFSPFFFGTIRLDVLILSTLLFFFAVSLAKRLYISVRIYV